MYTCIDKNTTKSRCFSFSSLLQWIKELKHTTSREPTSMEKSDTKKLLFDTALQLFREQGCENVCLWVMSMNTHAVMFYVHMGFHPTGRMQEENYGGENVELMELAKPL